MKTLIEWLNENEESRYEVVKTSQNAISVNFPKDNLHVYIFGTIPRPLYGYGTVFVFEVNGDVNTKRNHLISNKNSILQDLQKILFDYLTEKITENSFEKFDMHIRTLNLNVQLFLPPLATTLSYFLTDYGFMLEKSTNDNYEYTQTYGKMVANSLDWRPNETTPEDYYA